MKRIQLFTICTVVCLFFSLLVLTDMTRLSEVCAADSEVSAAKKIISVVYDDSGSMYDENSSWSAANYAMQAFAALLNEKDEMYITYMSDVGYETEGAVDIDLHNVDSAVKWIREGEKVGHSGGTPMRSVQIAMDKLKSIQEDDPNTQFWLVILTDGAMSPDINGYSDLQQLLNDYTGTTMSNGSQVYINYMGIGSAAVNIQGDSAKGLDSVQAGTDIVSALSDIANRISGRMEFTSNQMSQADARTLKIHSDIPLYTISVFSQSSNAQVTGISSETDMTVERNIPLKYPEVDTDTSDTSLFGNATLITNGDKVIPSGDYVITFSEDISLENLVVMYQPAIEMKAEIKKGGIVVDDSHTLRDGEVIDIEIIPTDPESGDPIPDSSLPEGITWKVGYSVDGQETDSAEGKILTGAEVGEGENQITCTMQIPEYVPRVQTISFTPVTAPEYGIEVIQPDDSVYNRGNLGIDGSKGGSVTFWITGDGERLSKEETQGLSLEPGDVHLDSSGVQGILNKIGFMNATPGIKQNDDGSYTLYPKSSFLPVFFLKNGNYTIAVELEGEPAEGQDVSTQGCYSLQGNPSDWLGLVPIIILLLIIIYLIYIFCFKAKFEGQTLYIDVFAPAGSMGEGKKLSPQCTQVILKKYGGDLFLPKSACTRLVDGIRIIADGSGGAYIKKNTVLAYDAYGNSGANPEEFYEDIASGLKQVKGKERDVPQIISLGSQAFYLKQKKRLYRITMK